MRARVIRRNVNACVSEESVYVRLCLHWGKRERVRERGREIFFYVAAANDVTE